MPSPWTGLLICVECSLLKADEDGLKLNVFGRRTLFLLGIVATFAFQARYAVKEIPAMPDISFAVQKMGEEYDNLMPFKAMLLRLFAAIAAILFFVVQAIFKRIFMRLKACIE